MKKFAYIAAAFALPMISFAAVSDLNGLGQKAIDIINTILVPLIFALAFLVFIWGVFQFFILGQGSEESRDNGKNLMIWGLLGFFVMVSVWGLVNLVVDTVDLNDTSNPPSYPDVPFNN